MNGTAFSIEQWDTVLVPNAEADLASWQRQP